MFGPRRWVDSPVKRVIDMSGAVLGLILLWPVMAFVAVSIRLRLGSPVLFRQVRAGRGATPIRVPKFRTMSFATDSEGALLPDAERLTGLGRRLRSMSLDELPQLLSVVRGDMSLVGPRPLPLVYVERYTDEQRRRLDARPGLTGWAQVQGRNALEWPRKLELDVWYVDNSSLALDIRIVLRTVKSVIGRGGVSAEGHATMPEFMGDR